MEKNITKGCPQMPCCGPGFWNLQYSALLNLSYTNHTKVVAFAEDLIIMIKTESKREAENIANVEMNIITAWAKDNKIIFNEVLSFWLLLEQVIHTKHNRSQNRYI